jgi:aldose 1-epimerase
VVADTLGSRMLTLRRDHHEVVLCPDIGGSIAAFRSEIDGRLLDWLRPAGAAALGHGDPRDTACFPLVPYSNRIRDGRFVFEGREICLPRNFGDHPHSIHGHGWQTPWRVAEAVADAAVMEYHHRADAWPFDYDARQYIRLDSDGLTVTLELVNRSAGAMPAGLGLHPYFPRTSETRVVAGVSELWQVDAEVMPRARVRPDGASDLNRGVFANRTALDNVYTGWDGRATIEWPERRASLEIAAFEPASREPLGFLVLFTPAGEDFLCVEPVSHCTDAFNLAAAGAADTGIRVLAPGESLEAQVNFTPGANCQTQPPSTI